MNLNQLKIFVTVFECKGFSAAARQLNLSPTAISKQIRNLEDALNVQLIERTTTKFEITDVGNLFYSHCMGILREMDDLKGIVQSYRTDPIGDLRIFSSIAFGEIFILPHLKEFSSKFPKVLLNLDFGDRIPDVQKEKIDLCFGLAGQWDSELVQKKLLKTSPCLLAAPSYLETNGEPTSRQDLMNHQFICHSNRPDSLMIPFKRGDSVFIKPHMFVNNYHALLACAINGLGLIYLYDYIAKPLIAAGQLKQIMPHEDMVELTYYAFYSPTNYMKPASREMLDFIVSKIS